MVEEYVGFALESLSDGGRGYASHWGMYADFCAGLGVDPLAFDAAALARFFLQRSRLRAATIESDELAIQFVASRAGVTLPARRLIGDMVKVRRTLQGRVAPPTDPARQRPPNIRDVLLFLKRRGPACTLSWRDLRQRAVFTLKCALMARGSDIAYLQRDYLQLDAAARTARFRASSSKTRQGYGPWVALSYCDDAELCGFQLWELLEGRFQSAVRERSRTAPVTVATSSDGALAGSPTAAGDQAGLFLALRPPFASLSRDSISNITKSVFDDFGTAATGHATRGLVASWLVSVRNTDVNEIIRACWRSDETFWRHYFQVPAGAAPIGNPVTEILRSGPEQLREVVRPPAGARSGSAFAARA